MSDRKDGGPAFPEGEHGAHLGGMSLRDYFAAHAMIVCVTVMKAPPEEIVARYAYRLADAMLTERAKVQP